MDHFTHPACQKLIKDAKLADEMYYKSVVAEDASMSKAEGKKRAREEDGGDLASVKKFKEDEDIEEDEDLLKAIATSRQSPYNGESSK